MNELIDLLQLNEIGARATAVEVIFTVLVCFALQVLISYSYIRTHRGRFYSQSFVHTLIIVGVTISVIIIVIGSNIARAFSLAGALSIIRFRSAIRDPRDVAYVFFSMGVGLACGAGLFTAADIVSGPVPDRGPAGNHGLRPHHRQAETAENHAAGKPELRRACMTTCSTNTRTKTPFSASAPSAWAPCLSWCTV
jgi:hypothetical protein